MFMRIHKCICKCICLFLVTSPYASTHIVYLCVEHSNVLIRIKRTIAIAHVQFLQLQLRLQFFLPLSSPAKQTAICKDTQNTHTHTHIHPRLTFINPKACVCMQICNLLPIMKANKNRNLCTNFEVKDVSSNNLPCFATGQTGDNLSRGLQVILLGIECTIEV